MEEAYFSVVKYVPDRVRYEPRNIGLILHIPQKGVIRHVFDSSAAQVTKLENTVVKSYVNQVKLFLDESCSLLGEPNKPSLLCDVREKYSESPIEVSEPFPCVSSNVEEDIYELFSRFVVKMPRHTVVSPLTNVNKGRALSEFAGILHKSGLIARDKIKQKFDVMLSGSDVLRFDFGYGDKDTPKLVLELAVVSGDINTRLREIATPLAKFDFLRGRLTTKTAAVLAYPKGSWPGEERELLEKHAEKIFSVPASPMVSPTEQVGEAIDYLREAVSL